MRAKAACLSVGHAVLKNAKMVQSLEQLKSYENFFPACKIVDSSTRKTCHWLAIYPTMKTWRKNIEKGGKVWNHMVSLKKKKKRNPKRSDCSIFRWAYHLEYSTADELLFKRLLFMKRATVLKCMNSIFSLNLLKG